MSYSIIVVDDHQLVLDGLISIVKEMDDFEIIGSAKNGKEGLNRCKIPKKKAQVLIKRLNINI